MNSVAGNAGAEAKLGPTQDAVATRACTLPGPPNPPSPPVSAYATPPQLPHSPTPNTPLPASACASPAMTCLVEALPSVTTRRPLAMWDVKKSLGPPHLGGHSTAQQQHQQQQVSVYDAVRALTSCDKLQPAPCCGVYCVYWAVVPCAICRAVLSCAMLCRAVDSLGSLPQLNHHHGVITGSNKLPGAV